MALLDELDEEMIDPSDNIEISRYNSKIEFGVKRPFDPNELFELEEWLTSLKDTPTHMLSKYEDGKYIFKYLSIHTPFYDIFNTKSHTSLHLSVVENILWIAVNNFIVSTSCVIYPNQKVIEWYSKYGKPDILVDLKLLFETNNPILGIYASDHHQFKDHKFLNSLQFQESIASLFIFNPIFPWNSIFPCNLIFPCNPEFESLGLCPCKDLAREYKKCDMTVWDNTLQEIKDNDEFQLWKIDKNLFACRIEKDHISEVLEENTYSYKKKGNNHEVFSSEAIYFKVNDSQTGKEKTIYLKLKYHKGPNGENRNIEIPDLEAYAFMV